MEYMLCTIILILTLVVINLIRKFDQSQDTVEQIELEQKSILLNLNNTFDNLREIDSKGGFASDDEVGQIFDAIKDEINGLEAIYGSNDE